jgi:alpha-L-rhamnosidase
MKKQIGTLLGLVFILIQLNCGQPTTLSYQQLLCEYQENPLGIGTTQPAFSWILTSPERGQVQTAYQILVSRDRDKLAQNSGDLWDSGQVTSGQSSHIVYQGAPLAGGMQYYWKIRVWDNSGKAIDFSPVNSFTTALLRAEDWQARWIGLGESPAVAAELGYYQSPEQAPDVEVDARSVLLRKKIEFAKPVKTARIFVTGLGYYELFLNGEKVGNRVLNPAKTFYRKQVLFDVFDVTELIAGKKLGIGLHLGNGWFNPLKKWWSWRMQWYGTKRAIFQLYLEFNDGTTETIISDASWKAASGPVVSSCVYDGEIYDARLEQPGWSKFDFDDSGWQTATELDAPGGEMLPQQMEAIEVTETIKPVKIGSPDSGVFVFDLGQNFAGWARLRVTGPAGTQISLKFAENAHPDGRLNPRTTGGALATDIFILKGTGTEIFEPRFTYHGFRFVEVTGFPGTPTLESLEGRVVHSACRSTGIFETSNPRLNRIHAATRWSQRSNMLGFPMDCPQRDERLGWMGDAHVTAEEAMFNFHTPLFYRNWLSGIKNNQNLQTGALPYISPRPFSEPGISPAWSSAYPLMVWYHYLHFGDRRILTENYSAIKKYVEFLRTQAKNQLQPRDEYGDWCSANATGWWKRGDPAGASTGYYFYDTILLAQMAAILGETADAKIYTDLAEQIRQAYHAHYFNPATKQYEAGTQCSNAIPLFLEITPAEQRLSVVENLLDDILRRNEGHLSTGILGTKFLMEFLSLAGRGEIAYLLANQTGYPSWDDMLRNRTTLSEHWNQSGSNNHVMFGCVDTWFYRYLAGIQVDPTGPGFEKIIIKPFIPPELSHVKAAVQTLKGEVSSEWECRGSELTLKTQIPVNATAQVFVFGKNPDEITESGRPIGAAPGVTFVRVEAPYVVFQVASGSYVFTSKNVKSLLTLPYAATPVISPSDSVIFRPDPAVISIRSATPAVQIFYTLDGREPSENDLLYTQPFNLTEPALITARAFRSGFQPSFRSMSQITFIDPAHNRVKYDYYEGAWQQLPDFEKLTPTRSGQTFQFELTPFENREHDFAVVFRAFLEILLPGKYTFYTQSNDGSQLFINDRLIVNNDGLHLVEEQQGSVTLSAGKHAIRVTYFQEGGGKKLQVFFEGPSLAKTEISAARLFSEE